MVNSFTTTNNIIDFILTPDPMMDMSDRMLQFCNGSVDYTLIAIVDYFSTVAEINEDNNEFQIDVNFINCKGKHMYAVISLLQLQIKSGV